MHQGNVHHPAAQFDTVFGEKSGLGLEIFPVFGDGNILQNIFEYRCRAYSCNYCQILIFPFPAFAFRAGCNDSRGIVEA